MDSANVARHMRACDGFSNAVAALEGRWDRASPCSEWDARGVVEHVIGFHDVLLLRPLGMKPERPRDDPAVRWAVTVPAVATALRDATAGTPLPVPGGPVPGGPGVDLEQLLPMLTTDVVVHTWDLAKAGGRAPELDGKLCATVLGNAERFADALRSSGMFAEPVPVPGDADPVTKLVALLGRDPEWAAP